MATLLRTTAKATGKTYFFIKDESAQLIRFKRISEAKYNDLMTCKHVDTVKSCADYNRVYSVLSADHGVKFMPETALESVLDSGLAVGFYGCLALAIFAVIALGSMYDHLHNGDLMTLAASVTINGALAYVCHTLKTKYLGFV